jgi:hypothetical protein
MPLIESFTPSVPVRHFRSLVFDKSLEIILENSEGRRIWGAADIANAGTVSNIDYKLVKYFLDNAKKTYKGKITLQNNLTIDIENKLISVRGYLLTSRGGGKTYMCSSESNTTYSIQIEFDLNKVITCLEYFYHVSTCV